MRKRSAAFAVFLIGALALAAPIFTALYLAQRASMDGQMAVIASIANDVLRRADEAGDQAGQAIEKLEQSPPADPCAIAKVELMAAIAVASNQLQAVGYVSDDQLVCSSLGSYGTRVPIGVPDYVSATHTYVRTQVMLPSITQKSFLILGKQRNGYVAVIDPQLPLDVVLPRNDASVGAYAYSNRHLVISTGYSETKWMDALGSDSAKDFSDGERLISLRRSRRYDIIAFAAIPISSVYPALRRQAEILAPIGIIAGLALAAAVRHLALLQTALPALLRSALKRREFFVEYQPIVDLRTMSWAGAEVLVRLRRHDGQVIAPGVFIPAAESCGLISKITEQVIEKVGREAPAIFDRYPDFYLSINLATADVATRDTYDLMLGLVEKTHARKGNLVVEATERGLVDLDFARDLFRKFHSLGIRVAIDDFGVGYSSLSYLQSFELDILKIDRSFVETLGTKAVTSQVIFHIIKMAKNLNLQLIAEGVETQEQANALRDQGVEFAQGWLFAKAMPMADLLSGLDKTKVLRPVANVGV